MTPRELIEAFGTLAEAPDGVKRLRELVLQLAVRGKLVPQVEGEEPAGKLLARLAKTNNVANAAEPQSPPHDIPASWAWSCLPAVASYTVGRTPATKDSRFWTNDGIPWVSIGDMIDGGSVTATSRSVTTAAAKEVFRSPPVPAGTMLMSFKLTIGKMSRLRVAAYHNEAIISIRPFDGMDDNYLFMVLPAAARGGESKDAIKGATLNSDSIARFPVPLPPLAEQHRIVAKVDELMAFLDKLEAAKTARDTTRKALRDAALAALREADSPDDAELAWGRIAEQMEELFAEPEDVAPLRQAVLQLAVRGRLVRQVEGDEAASTTLKRIAKTTYPDVGAADLLFPIPSNWAWCRMGNACDLVSGVAKGRKLSGGKVAERPYLRVANVQAGFLDLTVIKTIEATSDELEQYRLQTGDVVLTEGGDWDKLGRSAVWGGEIDDCIHQNHIFRARCLQGGILPQWLSKFTNSADGRMYFQSCSKQTTNLASINMTQLRNCPVPVPPLAEQHRIVAKVDELMALLDKLESRLRESKRLQSAFAAAAVHHLHLAEN